MRYEKIRSAWTAIKQAKTQGDKKRLLDESFEERFASSQALACSIACSAEYLDPTSTASSKPSPEEERLLRELQALVAKMPI